MLLKNIVSTFKKHQEWYDLTPQNFAQLEILLYLSLQIEDTYPANDLYMLLGSRNLIVKNHTFNLSDFMLSNAKINLKTLNQSKVFRDILNLYTQDRFEAIRFYIIEDNQVKRAFPVPKFYEDREEDYSKLLCTPFNKPKKSIKFAKNFNEHEYYYIAEGNRAIKINFPKALRPLTLDTCINKHKGTLSVNIKDILDTAYNIDAILGNPYRHKVLSNSKLLEISENNLSPAQNLLLNGVTHMIGQVGAGKSTIAESLTVVLASRGARIVIIEATVQESIAKAKLLSKLGVNAVCILGKSGRLGHINAAINEQDFLDEYYSKVLTPGCLIGALCNKSDETIQYGNEPCHSLKRFTDDNTLTPTNYVCPFYYQCPKTHIDKQFLNANVIVTTLEGLCSTSMLAERELIFNHILDHTDLVIIDEADSALGRLDQIFAPSIGVNKYIQANLEIQNEYGRRPINNKVDADERTFVEAMGEFAKALTEIWARIKDVSTGFSKSRLKKFTALQLLNLLHEDVEQLTTEEKLPQGLWHELYQLASPKLTDNQVNLLSLAFNEEVSWTFKLKFIGYDINQFAPITQRKIQFIIMLIAFDQLYRKLSGLVRDNNSLPISTKQLLNQSFTEHQKWLCSAPIGNMLAFETKEDDLVITKQFATGRSLALKFPWLKVDESGNPLGPNVLLMSGTSFAPKSYMNHINTSVNYIIEAEKYKRDYISQTQFIYSRSDIRVSGAEDEVKNENLKKLLNENIDIILNSLQSGDNILMIVNKYEQASYLSQQLNKFLLRHGYSNISIALKSDSNNTVSEQHLTRSKVKTFDNRILVAPAIAIERGHNIVDKFGNSKFDTLMFLVRPMNDPTDHGLHVKKVNGYIMTKYNNDVYKASVNTYTAMRQDAFALYSKLTANKYGLNQLDKDLQEDITATLFVMLIQIFGRLCRISDENHIKKEPLKVYFLDGAFRAKSQKDYDFLGELVNYLEELIEDPLTGNIAKTLYEPIYIGLKGGNI